MAAKTAGQRWLAVMEEAYDIADSLTETFRLAAEALDRAEAAEAAIREDGVLVQGLHGKKQNPAVIVKRDAVQEFARLSRLLGLHDQEVEEA
jgi:phage terminase small subunit